MLDPNTTRLFADEYGIFIVRGSLFINPLYFIIFRHRSKSAYPPPSLRQETNR